MKKYVLMACLVGATAGLGTTWMPQAAEAGDLTTTKRTYGINQDCGYNNLFCEAGTGWCVICNAGTNDVTCKEQQNCGLTGG